VVYHTLTWMAWLCAAAYLTLVNHQPLVSILLIVATAGVFSAAGRRSPLGQSWGAFLRLGLSMWLVALAFNLLSTHAGRIVLLTLPRSWPLVGGPITLEAMLYGLSNGATLFAILLVFAAFNLAVDRHRLLRWVPAGLYQAGLVVSIALAFVPQIVTSLRDIREAQRIRGHRFKGLRDLVPLFVPLVTTALERSLTLAESIEARGFGGSTEVDGDPSRTEVALINLAGLGLLFAGLLGQTVLPQARWPCLSAGVLGAALLLLALYLQGRGIRRTHYRRELWRLNDTLVTLACTASILIVSYVRRANPLALWYYPFPPSPVWPTLSPWLGLAAMLITAPALLGTAPPAKNAGTAPPAKNAGTAQTRPAANHHAVGRTACGQGHD